MIRNINSIGVQCCDGGNPFGTSEMRDRTVVFEIRSCSPGYICPGPARMLYIITRP